MIRRIYLNHKSYCLNFLFLLIIIFFPITGVADQSSTVNVLVWFGYLNSPWISKMVKDDCNVDLSYDEFNSNSDFLRRLKAQNSNYDIIIFSDTVFSAVNHNIALNKSDLWKQSFGYNKYIRQEYIKSKFPKNVVYFMQSLTGFDWNPDTISLSSNDSISTIFRKAKTNSVIMIDDPEEVEMLLQLSNANMEASGNASKETFTLDNFKKLTQNAKIYISNQSNQIFNRKDFAFAYQWSGASLFERNANITHRFLIEPQLSYVSSDLLANLNNKPSTVCVAKLLSSKEFLSRLQNESYYFSPYGDIGHVPPGEYRDMYTQFLKELPHLKWIKSYSLSDFESIDQKWKLIKVQLQNENP